MANNMSYCRFRNTLTDLRDCQESLENEDKLSPEEQKARDKLIKLCINIVDNYGDLPYDPPTPFDDEDK